MKHLFLLFLLAFCSLLPAFAQSVDYTSLYYPHINKAELAITNNDFSST